MKSRSDLGKILPNDKKSQEGNSSRPTRLLPEDSLLIQTNSWNGFVLGIRQVLRAKDYRFRAIYTLLQWVDPSFQPPSRSISCHLYGWLIGPGFPSGRKALYYDMVQLFLKKYQFIFQDAPLEVITVWNELVKTLFPSSEDYSPLILDEKLAYRKKSKSERILEEGKKAQDAMMSWVYTPPEALFPKKHALDNVFEIAYKDDTSIAQTIEKKRDPVFPDYDLFELQSAEELARFIGTISESEKSQFLERLTHSIQPYKTSLKELLNLGQNPLLLQFKDYSVAVDKCLHLSFSKTELEDEKSFFPTLLHYVDERTKEIERVLQRFRFRIQKIEQIEHLKHDLVQKLRPFIQRKDLEKRIQSYLTQIEKSIIPLYIYQEEDSVSVDQSIESLHSHVHNLFQEIGIQCNTLVEEMSYVEGSVEKKRQLFYINTWPLFTGDVLYPDLASLAVLTQKRVGKALNEVCEKAKIGAISQQEYFRSISDLMYDPDALLIRAEIMQRSRRVYDVRKAARNEILSFHFVISFAYMLDDSIHVQDSFASIFRKLDRFQRFCFSLFDPQKIFAQGADPESINRIFRSQWIEIEEWQKDIPNVTEAVFQYILGWIHKNGTSAFFQKLFHPILRAADRLQKFGRTTKERALYERILALEIHLKSLFSTDNITVNDVRTITEYVTNEVKTLDQEICPGFQLFFQGALSVEDSKNGEEIARRIRNIFIKKDAIFSFGKAIQAITTDNIEYVDALFEFFDDMGLFFIHFPVHQVQNLGVSCIESLDKIDKALIEIEQSLLLHLGSLDNALFFNRSDLQENLYQKSSPIISDILEIMTAYSSCLGIEKLLWDRALYQLKEEAGHTFVSSPTEGFSIYTTCALLLTAKAILPITGNDSSALHPQDGAYLASWLCSILHDHVLLNDQTLLSHACRNIRVFFYDRLSEWREGKKLETQSAISEEPLFITNDLFSSLTESPEIAQITKDFLTVITALQKRVLCAFLLEQESRTSLQSHFRPFLCGDISRLIYS